MLIVLRANLPVFEALYKSVRDGSETRRSLDFNSRKTYRQDLQKELDEIDNQEIWRAGKTVRGLRVSGPMRWLDRHRSATVRSLADNQHSPTRTRTSFRMLSLVIYRRMNRSSNRLQHLGYSSTP